MPERRRQRFAGGNAHTQRRQVVPLEVVDCQHARVTGRHIEQERRFEPMNCFQNVGGRSRWLRAQHCTRADVPRREQIDAKTEGEKQTGDGESPVMLSQPQFVYRVQLRT